MSKQREKCLGLRPKARLKIITKDGLTVYIKGDLNIARALQHLKAGDIAQIYEEEIPYEGKIYGIGARRQGGKGYGKHTCAMD